MINSRPIQPSLPLYRQEARPVTFAPTSAVYKEWHFPWNVYAHASLLQEGRITDFHYGLCPHDITDLQAAQQYATDLLIARLPPLPCRILQVGVGLGTTLSLLTQYGYSVQSIASDTQQITYVRTCLKKQAAVACQQLADFEAEAGSFDLILFQESAQSIEPLIIFNKALDLLSPSGSILIMDEFALKRTETTVEKLHLLDDITSLAERFGFKCVEQLDLTSMATPMLDYRLSVTTAHQQQLIQDLTLNHEKLTQLNASIQRYRKKYTDGHYGYGLLHFKKESTPKWRLKSLKQQQSAEMRHLFEKTFNHCMTPATWHWKYGAVAGQAIGIWRNDRLIAHYGGTARHILLCGQAQTAVQIGDVMVDASERGTLTRKGPFFLMAATFLERYIGYGKPYLIGFGFPNERAMKVAERHGLYAEVGRMTEFSWPPSSRLPQWKTRLQPIDQAVTSDTVHAIDACWQRMANDLQDMIVGIRDWRFLQYRYLQHPSQRYQLILVKNRLGERVRGLLVLRHDADGCEIVDLVAPLHEIALLVTQARRLAGLNGHRRLFCRITENFAALFSAAGGIRQALNIRIPANIWSHGPPPEALKDRWWLMSGDTDFR